MKSNKIALSNLFLRFLPLIVLRVNGHSMAPIFKNGRVIWVLTWVYFFSFPQKGDIVVFNYQNKILVKRVRGIEGKRFLLEGDNQKDSLQVGWISKNAIWGKVLK